MSAKDGQCRLLQHVCLNNSYEHTIWFSTEAQQESYFKSKTKAECSFNNLSHTQIYAGEIMVEHNPDDLYNVNYMMLRNANKWFYCFVTGVIYVSDACAKIQFEIDAIQTWLFNFSIKKCYVERMHVLSDAKWSWRCPEPFPAVELRYTNMQNVPSGQDGWHKSYIVYAGYRYYTGKWLKGAGRQLNGTFYGCVMYLCHTETELLMCIAEQKKQADNAVYAVQVVPTFLTTKLTRRESTTGKNGGWEIINPKGYVTTYSSHLAFSHDKIGTYKPRNNKLFNYPYYGLYITNQQGINDTYDFAFFGEKTAIPFTFYGDIGINNSVVLKIGNYKANGGHDFDIQMGQNPQCTFNTDISNAYENSQANLKVQGTLTAVSDATSAFSGAVTGAVGGAVAGGPVGAVIGAVGGAGAGITSGIMHTLELNQSLAYAEQQYHNSPPAVHNLVGNSDLSFKANFEKPRYGIRCMSNASLRRLDDFLDVYGYQVNILTTPNRSGRRHWNYVKTANCAINGTVPSWADSVICKAHDSGITYWKNGNNIGNYSLDNTL